MMERNLTIKNIKQDSGPKVKEFFKVFFEEKKVLIRNKETNVDEPRDKVHFVWPDSQAFHMIKEGQVKEGLKVMCDVEEKDGWLTIKSMELNKKQESLY